jgi:hypothetical protein
VVVVKLFLNFCEFSRRLVTSVPAVAAFSQQAGTWVFVTGVGVVGTVRVAVLITASEASADGYGSRTNRTLQTGSGLAMRLVQSVTLKWSQLSLSCA